jgi:P pilus assembly chaperone PapD
MGVALTVVLWMAEAFAIVVAPTAVYITDGEPASVVTLYNPSNVPEEVTVGTLFGYPTTDEDGRLYLHVDSAGDDPRSAADWIRALPRRVVVPPGERRVVRLLARPPVGTPDGEYWTRLVLTSRGQRIPVEGGDSASVSVGLNMQVRTIISVTYRQGAVTTSVGVDELDAEFRGDSLVVRPGLARLGEGAYIGTMRLALATSDGVEVASWEEQVAVYRAYARRYAYEVPDIPPGTYQLVIRLTTERDDIPPEDRLVSDPVEVAVEVVKP